MSPGTRRGGSWLPATSLLLVAALTASVFALEPFTPVRDTAPLTGVEGSVKQDTPATGLPANATPADLYGAWVFVPPVVTIVLAIWLRQVIPALAVGILVAACMVWPSLAPGVRPAGGGAIGGLRLAVETYLVGALADADHVKIVLFTLTIGGMVGIIAANGGTAAIVDVVARWASNRRRGQLATWLAGLVVFFDDYASAMIVGPTMRPVCDRLRISRAKLAYLVDSTAAPIASLAFIGTWIGAEVGFIQEGLSGLAQPPAFLSEFDLKEGFAYQTFLSSIPYRFYPILALVMVVLVGLLGRDFGPMCAAEREAAAPAEAAATQRSADETCLRRQASAATFRRPARKESEPLTQVRGPESEPLTQVRGPAPPTGVGGSAGPAASVVSPPDCSLMSGRDARAPLAGAEKARLRHWYAGLPVLVLVITTLGLLVATGWHQVSVRSADETSAATGGTSDTEVRRYIRTADETSAATGAGRSYGGIALVQQIVSNGDPYNSILYGAVASIAVAVAISLVTRTLRLAQIVDSATASMARMLPTMTVLVLAWALSAAMQALELGEVARRLLQDADFDARWLPLLIFVAACVVSFSTGTSWGTMGILCPAAVTISAGLLADWPAADARPLFYASVGAVLAGAVFGDHCSPISDTTVLSAAASECSLEAHVWTQAPYALLVAGVSILCGDLLCRQLGQPWWLGLLVGTVLLAVMLRVLGRRPPVSEGIETASGS